MAIREYVGARYVPRFTGLYDATQIYDALDVVDNGIGTSYIAKKTVPAGTPLTDTDYWFVYGASSGAILDLQTRMSAAEGNINDLDIITENNDEKIASIKHKKYIIIGDSYERVTSFGSAVSGYLEHGATSFISTNVQKSSDGYIYVASRGGSGFTNDGGGKSSGNGFLNMLTEARGQMTADEAADIDCILIAGGVNDSFYNIGDPDIALLSDRMNAFNTYARANFPKAEINLFFLGRVRQLDTHVGLNPVDVRYNVYRYIDLAGRKGWGYITNSEYVSYYREAFIDSDNLHPTTSETNVIAKYIVEGLINGSVDVQWVSNDIYLLTPISGITPTQPVNISCNIMNSLKRFEIPGGFALNPTPAITLTIGVPYKVGTQDAIFCSSPYDIPIPCLAYVENAGTPGFKMLNCVLRLYGYDVYLTSLGCESMGNTHPSVSGLVFPTGFSCLIDSLNT